MIDRIALLGATGHIAKNIIVRGLIDPNQEWSLFSRRPQYVQTFIENEVVSPQPHQNLDYQDFEKTNYDVIINTVGITENEVLINHPSAIFEADSIDTRVLSYLLNGHEATRYIHFSSGAVYGDVYDEEVTTEYSRIPISPIEKEHYYGISKLYLEARHRAYPQLLISDIRIYNFFSRFIDLNSKYLVVQLINACREVRVFETSSEAIYRDFLHPDDLWAILQYLFDSKDAFPTIEPASLEKISKSDMIQLFVESFGLIVYINKNSTQSTKENKTYYYPRNPFSPIRSTMTSHETILSIARQLPMT